MITVTDENGNEIVYEKMSHVSDGYHNFSELYRYRMLLQAMLFGRFYESMNYHTSKGVPVSKSWRHSDGELCFGKDNYFVVTAELPTGQITNHYKGEYWDLFDIPEEYKAPKYDGHTPQEAADRMERYLKEYLNAK